MKKRGKTEEKDYSTREEKIGKWKKILHNHQQKRVKKNAGRLANASNKEGKTRPEKQEKTKSSNRKNKGCNR